MTESDRPFVAPSTKEWQQNFVEAALASAHVNVPRSALEAIAPLIVRPKELLTRATNDRPAQLRAIREINTSAGQMFVLDVRLVGCAGSVWERNERQSSAWAAPSDPGSKNKHPLPLLAPWVDPEDPEQPGAALSVLVKDPEELRLILEKAGNELMTQVNQRTYDLTEDLALNGQLEPCLLVPQEYRFAVGGSVWAWPAVRGNNRTKARQELFGLTSSEIITGVPMNKIGRPGPDISTNPSFWLKALADKLNDEFQKAKANDEITDMAFRAHRVAVVEAQLVVGTPTPERLYQIVQTSNRRDHVHPPLEFKPNDRARALGRGIIGAYQENGLLDEITAGVLTGELPIIRLAGVPGDATVSMLRDLRSMRLLAEFFPVESEKEKRRAIRAALSEPPASQLTREHVNQRLRAWSALTSVSYPDPWNPRVADVLPTSIAKEGFRPSGRALADLLATATIDPQTFEELLMYRAAHWLAAYDIVEADRGSMGAQTIRAAAGEDEDSEQTALRIRRSVTNSLNAMREDRVRAVGLLREIAAAMDEDRQPRKVNETGTTGPEAAAEADRDWFNTVFPKVAPKRGRIVMRADESPNAAPSPPESATDAVVRLTIELETVIGNLHEEAKLIPELVEQMRSHAAIAGIGQPLSEPTATTLIMKLVTTTRDLREAPDLILQLTRDVS
ncbi:hypothetical protein [Spirillospora sp. NBC_01491]|uniref:hypothetical protein n=1 Tax=Spirillospora sp. NBC_01491 TaxID=2976007 RepID=UPI002E35A551|nr:hypothetical protein [Spirillospora sp. NBC_01491]